jgi:sulfate adenylyltransferase subunit 1
VLEQTIRHAYIASLLRIPHVVICINKMDLKEYNEEVFEHIKKDFNHFAAKLDILDMMFIPISALNGDNVVDRSTHMNWYQGPTLLYLLENIHIASDLNLVDGRFPVQYVIRPQSQEYHDYRGYAGRIASGIFTVGDKVKILPSGFTSSIKTIDCMNETLESAFAPMSVTITLEDDIDISRGDMIVPDNKETEINQDIEMMICWLSEKPMILNGKYTLRHTTNDVKCIIKELAYKMNINNLEKNTSETSLGLNEIGRLRVRTTKPLFYDPYRTNRITGSIILIDEGTNNTVGAGMII